MKGFRRFQIQKTNTGILGLVGCSGKKLAVPAPAHFLYSASPMFALNYNAAKSRCEEVLIVSAHYGLLQPSEWISPYDFQLKELSPKERLLWLEEIRSKLPDYKQMLIYAGGPYCELLKRLPNSRIGCAGNMFERSTLLGSGQRLKPHYWPMNWLLLWVYSTPAGVCLKEIEAELRKRKYQEATVKAQVDRTARCPIHYVRANLVFSKAHKEMQNYES